MSRKAETRRIALEIRRQLAETHRQVADQAILAAAVRLATGLRQIAAYLPMPGEPGGGELVDALSAVTEVILPVLRPDRDLDWARYSGPASLRPAVGGGPLLREPVGALLGPEAIAAADLILVPALAVDGVGTRLGRGGGSYDRALARVAAGMPVVALLYDDEPHEGLPAEPHDRVVTAILSPAGLREDRHVLSHVPVEWVDESTSGAPTLALEVSECQTPTVTEATRAHLPVRLHRVRP